MLESVLQVSRELGLRHEEGSALFFLGRVDKDRGEYAQSLGKIKESLQIFQGLGAHASEGTALLTLGDLYRALGKQARAAALWQAALEKLPPDSPDYTEAAGRLERVNLT